jgi:hypothetical protein
MYNIYYIIYYILYCTILYIYIDIMYIIYTYIIYVYIILYYIYTPSGSQTWLAGKSPSYFDDLTIYRNLNLVRISKP